MSCSNTTISFEQGADARIAFTPTAAQIANGTVNLTGNALALSVFLSKGNTTPILTLTTAAGNITYSNATVGNFTAYFTRTVTSALEIRNNYYGVWRTDSGNYGPFVEGTLRVLSPSYPPT